MATSRRSARTFIHSCQSCRNVLERSQYRWMPFASSNIILITKALQKKVKRSDGFRRRLASIQRLLSPKLKLKGFPMRTGSCKEILALLSASLCLLSLRSSSFRCNLLVAGGVVSGPLVCYQLSGYAMPWLLSETFTFPTLQGCICLRAMF